MHFVLNVIWLVLCGIWMAIGYVVAGVICCILIVTIPFGIASFRIAAYALWPFGRTVIRHPTAGFWSALGNVIWFVVAGIWLAIGHVITGILLCITIIGIPFGVASFKLARLALTPFGKIVVKAGAPLPPNATVYLGVSPTLYWRGSCSCNERSTGLVFTISGQIDLYGFAIWGDDKPSVADVMAQYSSAYGSQT